MLYVPPGLAVPAVGPARAGAVAPALRGAPGPALQEGGEVEQLLAGRNVRNSKRISFSNMYLLCTDNPSHMGGRSVATYSAPQGLPEHQAWAQFGNTSVQELFPNASIGQTAPSTTPLPCTVCKQLLNRLSAQPI